MRWVALLLLLCAATATAAEPDWFYRERLLYESNGTYVAADGGLQCLTVERYHGLNSAVCENEWTSNLLVLEDFVLTRIVIVVDRASGDAGAECTVTLQDYTHTAYPEMPAMVLPADVESVSYAFTPTNGPFLVADGSFMEFALDAGGAACTSALAQDPMLRALVYGFPLWDLK